MSYLRFCFVFRPLVYPMLPVSLDCSFLIVPWLFSNVYLLATRLGPRLMKMTKKVLI